MDLTALYKNNVFVKGKSQTQTPASYASKVDNGFNSILEKMNEPVKKQSTANTYNQRNRSETKRKSDVSTSKSVQKTVDDKNSEPVNNTANSTGTTKKQATAKTAEAETASTSSQELERTDDAISQLSELFNVSKESIQQILAALNISVSDLSDKTHLNDFMQELFKTNSPVELLNVLGIMDTIAAVEDIVSGISESNRDNVNNHMLGADITEIAPTDPGNDEKSVVSDRKEASLSTHAKESSPNNQTTPIQSSPIRTADITNTETSNDSMNNTSNEVFGVYTPAGNTTAPTRTTAAAEMSRSINTADVVDQIVETMKSEVRGSLTEIKITLKPEHLGDVSLKIATENGIITAQFTAENQRVKEIIEASFNQLRSTLEQQGIQISQLSVSVGQDDSQRRMEQFLKEQQVSSRRISMILNNVSGDDLEVEDEQDGLYRADNVDILDNSIDYAV